MRRCVAALASGLIIAVSGISGAQAAPARPHLGAHPGDGARAGAAKGAGTAPLTEARAMAQARRTGRPVVVGAAQTPTTTLTANPSGTFTVAVTAQPVRKLVAGGWRPLDATLRKNPDGTISPVRTTTPLVLSGGGQAPLAVMRSGADSLSLKLPSPLPVPVVAGATATYRNVLPGTDLVVTADLQGGFSDVYVVRDATAAASSRLASLLSATVAARHLTVSVGAGGAIMARDRRGRVIFGAAAPDVWDSAARPGAARVPPTRSTSTRPGPAARPPGQLRRRTSRPIRNGTPRPSPRA
jgi:hypothetical protein